jgi:hypothetical protein
MDLAVGEESSYGGYIPTRLSACHGVLVIVMANIILIGSCLRHSLKGMVGYGGRN